MGVNFTPAQRQEVALGLAAAGIEELELGIAGRVDADLVALIRLLRELPVRLNVGCQGAGRAAALAAGSPRSLRLALWSRCRVEDILAVKDLGLDVLSLSLPVSERLARAKLSCPAAELPELAARIIRLAKAQAPLVSLGLEDATRAEPALLAAVTAAAVKAGVDRIRLADTVGIATPGRITALVRRVREQIGPVEIAVHTHNDFGMATANAIAALEAGADWADAALLGLGERAGMARLEEVAGYLALQGKREYDPKMIKELCRLAAGLSGRPLAPHQPVVGSGIFRCESGLHLAGLARDPAVYEPFDPALVGSRRALLYGGKIGRRAMRDQLARLRPAPPAESGLNELVERVRQRAGQLGRPLEEGELHRFLAELLPAGCRGSG